MLLYSIVWLDKKGCEGDLGFEKRESSFEDLVETVNLRYRNYWWGHFDELIKTTRLGLDTLVPLFSKYNEVKTSGTEKRKLAIEC